MGNRSKCLLWYRRVVCGGFLTTSTLKSYIRDSQEQEANMKSGKRIMTYSAEFLADIKEAMDDLQGDGYNLFDNVPYDIPLITITSEDIDPEEPGSNTELRSFCKLAKSKGYDFYNVPYSLSQSPLNIRYWWLFD